MKPHTVCKKIAYFPAELISSTFGEILWSFSHLYIWK
uniref:Uncharacterized protein n=1 Tax=Rhizophora mucronata TaxID=61149 RepID=A0A2P2NB24_RHIMU